MNTKRKLEQQDDHVTSWALENIVKTLLSIDDTFTGESCIKINDILKKRERFEIVELCKHITESLEKEIPQHAVGTKVWIGVPYLVNKFEIHKRILILQVANHVLGEIDEKNNITGGWQESYR